MHEAGCHICLDASVLTFNRKLSISFLGMIEKEVSKLEDKKPIWQKTPIWDLIVINKYFALSNLIKGDEASKNIWKWNA
ncbi:unnamed protein product [Blepharisma stoltei]|uniref:Uncharacterized protein n=1 Tax=Blepharisma stoltei TaxID=1481888 RepID=A0AAU9J064_9CILI|nr:unnamed protein product [Blepharisma stoltei]